MKPLTLTLRQRPDQRLDLSPLVPHGLAGKTAREIEQIDLQTTRRRVKVGDVFQLRMGDVEQIRIQRACDRLDYIGREMSGGEILVEGDVGVQAGRLLAGGRLTVIGNVGPWAASGMKAGVFEIRGAAGERLGGPLAGEIAGMRGGVVVVRGSAGERAGDRMRRGTIIVEGKAGHYAGSRMIAGTLIVRRSAGPLPGYLLKRGTIVLGEGSSVLSPTFVDCGRYELVAMRWLAGMLEPYSKAAVALLRGPLTRFAGDMAILGKGEIFVGNRN
ncbi:MAG: formylmethanofuran dehydrogenase subunit C [Xanthobacteraceae bacterium]